MEPVTMSNNFFLVRVSVSQWGARKLDKNATQKAKASSGAADKAAVKVYKTVLAVDELETIQQIASAAGAEHRKRTVPWSYEGVGAITAEGYPAYKAAMETYRNAFNVAVDQFYSVYAEEREAARGYLGELFNAADYPSTLDIASKFKFTIGVEPAPQAEAFNPHNLAPELVADIKRDIVANNRDAVQNANATGWQRVIELVTKLQLRLEEYTSGKAKKFFPGWVDNVKELAEFIPSINIAGDPDLTRIAQRLIALTAYSADELKDDHDLCDEIAREAAKVLKSINEAHRKAA
jgi:hypothetical protein